LRSVGRISMSRPARTIAVALLALIGCGLSILCSAETTEPLRPAGVSVTGKPLGEAPFTLHRNVRPVRARCETPLPDPCNAPR
jgi:hypothetical protein